jgi:hypothetical protein
VTRAAVQSIGISRCLNGGTYELGAAHPRNGDGSDDVEERANSWTRQGFGRPTHHGILLVMKIVTLVPLVCYAIYTLFEA